MINAVLFEDRARYASLLDDMHVARHRLYVEGRKWRELAKADGREKDQFDRDSTIYFLSQGKDQSLHGGLRIVPSTEPHMLDSLFPELCTIEDIPRGPDIWEMSRIFVCHSEAFDEEGLIIKGKLMCAMIEFAEANGISKITGVTDSYFLPRLLQIGADIKPLGLPKPYASGEMVAICINIDDTTLEKAQAHYNIPRRMLGQQESTDQIEDLEIISDEVMFLKERGFLSQREEFLEEFAEIVHLLGSNDQRVVTAAEHRLDDLSKRVRESKQMGGEFFQGTATLQ